MVGNFRDLTLFWSCTEAREAHLVIIEEYESVIYRWKAPDLGI